MSRYGWANRTNIHLSQKKTCGRIDRGARVYSGCYALNDGMRLEPCYCALGCSIKKLSDGYYAPTKPCLKPRTEAQLCYAHELRKDNR
jgi:hypothetical protein